MALRAELARVWDLDPGVDVGAIGCVPITGALRTVATEPLPQERGGGGWSEPGGRGGLGRKARVAERLARVRAESRRPGSPSWTPGDACCRGDVDRDDEALEEAARAVLESNLRPTAWKAVALSPELQARAVDPTPSEEDAETSARCLRMAF